MKIKLRLKRSSLILLLIILISLSFRLISVTIGIDIQNNLDSSIFPDEASFLLYARYILTDTPFSQSISYHGSLILSSLIAFLYSIFGVHALLGRIISVILGGMTTIVIYLFSKELFNNEKIALFSSFLVAISSILRFWDMRALSDGPLTFFFTLSLYLFYKGYKTEKLKYFFFAGISSTITFLIKFPGIIIFPIITVYFIILTFKSNIKKRKRVMFLKFLIIMIIFSGTMVILLLSQFTITFQPFIQISFYIQNLLNQTANFFYYIFYLLSLNVVFGSLVLLFLVILIIYSLLRLNSEIILLLTWCGSIFLFFSFYGESELYRYLLPSFPALYMLIANFFITSINNSINIFKSQNQIMKKGLVILLICSLFVYMGSELIFGEYIIVKRSNTYKGTYYCSNWLLMNTNYNSNIMAPSNALSQIDFYTNGNFNYFPLSTENDWTSIVNDLKSKNINYVIISILQYPETQDLSICTLIHSYLIPIYNSTNGAFITYLFNTTGL
ncbi:MAG: ArnT family glycosyltransferase [Candidatus Helarchaeota archaeon]